MKVETTFLIIVKKIIAPQGKTEKMKFVCNITVGNLIMNCPEKGHVFNFRYIMLTEYLFRNPSSWSQTRSFNIIF
jgi:hypothetical protein